MSITLWIEPIRQRLFGIYTLLSLIYVEHYTTIALPCLNTKQTAAETDCKGQHALVTACLLGNKVRYDGNGLLLDDEAYEKLKAYFELIPLCPEISVGLSTPRAPAEIQHSTSAESSIIVKQNDGLDLSDTFLTGATNALSLCQLHDIKFALLTQGSPSCGNSEIYDDSFSGKKIIGRGVTADLLIKNGINVYNQYEIEQFTC